MAMHATKIIALYEEITGEAFQDALYRMAKENHTGEEAAHFIGFCGKQRLGFVIKRLGYIPVVFRGKKKLGKSAKSLWYHKQKLLAAETNQNKASD